MAEQMTFIIGRKGVRWWGRTFCAPDWWVFSDERAEVEQACRGFVAERTGRPSSETTILFVDEPLSSPQRDALCAIDDRLSSLEYEVGGLRVVVNEALLLEARSDSDRAVERVRKLAERARPVISRGCTCPGDDCTGCRRGEPMGWGLDPAQVLAALDGYYAQKEKS